MDTEMAVIMITIKVMIMITITMKVMIIIMKVLMITIINKKKTKILFFNATANKKAINTMEDVIIKKEEKVKISNQI